MKTVYIYVLTDPRTDEVRYVGVSKNPKGRLKGHIKDSIRGKNSHKCNWIRKLLSEKLFPKQNILEECDESVWQERERYWIKYYRDLGCKLTNMTDGGEGIIGYKFTDEAKAKNRERVRIMSLDPEYRNKQRETQLRRFEDPEEREKYRRLILSRYEDPEERAKQSERTSGEGNPFYGKHHNEESKVLIRNSTIKQLAINGNPFQGRTHSEESKERMRKSQIGNNVGEHNPMYGRRGVLAPAYGRTGDKHPMYGKKHKTESKQKISDSLKKFYERKRENDSK